MNRAIKTATTKRMIIACTFLVMASFPIAVYAADTAFDKIDANRDAQIDIKEFNAAVEKTFERYDRSRDGFMEREEFKAGSGGNTDKLFILLDTDKDGRVNKKEFLTGAQERFKLFDKSDDGFIDRRELNAGRSQPELLPFLKFYF